MPFSSWDGPGVFSRFRRPPQATAEGPLAKALAQNRIGKHEGSHWKVGLEANLQHNGRFVLPLHSGEDGLGAMGQNHFTANLQLLGFHGPVSRNQDPMVRAHHQACRTGLELNDGIHLMLLRWVGHFSEATIGRDDLGTLEQLASR